MRKPNSFFSLLLALCLVVGMLPIPTLAVSGAHPFSDVPDNAWYSDAVQYVYEHGLMNGTDFFTFSPDTATSRGMLVTILHRMEGTPPAMGIFFSDVPSGKYYTDSVAWASANHIAGGYGDGRFGPDDPVTREQLAVILYRYAMYKGFDLTASGHISAFPDGDKVSSWAVAALDWALERGLISGTGNHLLQPAGSATRAETATILARFCQNVVPQVFTVTFDLNYTGAEAPAVASVKGGQKVSAPTEPSRRGYTFDGWYTATVRGRRFDFDTSIQGDITLYAQWTERRASKPDASDKKPSSTPRPGDTDHTVTFDINCRDAIAAPARQTVQHGDYAVAPSVSQRDGYQFAGWFLDEYESDWTNTFSFEETPIEEDVTLHAIWVDLVTDTDGDGLSNDLERYCGTNIRLADTDRDGLTDYQEVVLLGTDPTLFDTDGDGRSDANEDDDADGLSNGEELSRGTSPTESDSDGDGLTDREEINYYLTDPLDPDTDKDGASDGWEIKHNFKPRENNSRFPLTVTAQAPSKSTPVTAGVSAELSGSAASSLTVTPVGASSNPLLSASIPGSLGSAYDFSVEGGLHEAELEFRYDGSLETGPDFQPRIFYFNEETGRLEQPDYRYTETDNAVGASVSHFSTYLLLNMWEYERVWEPEIARPILGTADGEDASLEIVFVIDSSANMAENDPNGLVRELSADFVSKLRDGQDRAAVITFAEEAALVSPLTADKDALISALEGVSYDAACPGTDGSAALRLALDELSRSTSKNRTIVFIAGGQNAGPADAYYDLANEAFEKDVVIYAVGLDAASEADLQTLAYTTGGEYYLAATDAADAEDMYPADIRDVFSEIEGRTIDLTIDSNGDGIPDYYNDLILSGELVLSNGSNEFYGIDFNFDADGSPSADWDGDGLKNGEELLLSYDAELDRVYLTMLSDPTMVHSDGDGVSDYDEVKSGTDPLTDQSDSLSAARLVEPRSSASLRQMDAAYSAAVFGLKGVEEQCLDATAAYALNDASAFDREVEREKRAILVGLADGLLGTLTRYHEEIGAVFYYQGLLKGVKSLMDDANGYSAPLAALCDDYSGLVEELVPYSPAAATALASTYRLSAAALSVLAENAPSAASAVSGAPVAFDARSGKTDLSWAITALAIVNTSLKLFDESVNSLIALRDNAPGKNTRAAAEKLLDGLSASFGSLAAGRLGQSSGQLTLENLMALASSDPYLSAVRHARNLS